MIKARLIGNHTLEFWNEKKKFLTLGKEDYPISFYDTPEGTILHHAKNWCLKVDEMEIID